MPYAAREGKDGAWEVINTETNTVKAVHKPPDAETKAKKQVELLAAIENDPGWDQEE